MDIPDEIIDAVAHHDALKTFDLPGEELFQAGTWTSGEGNKKTYSIDDLEIMAQAAQELGTHLKIPVKLGHNDKQKVIFDDGEPAAGWVHNLRVAGDKLIGDLRGVPRKIYELIKAGAYKNKSLEIWHDFKDEATGKIFKHAPTGLAILGAHLPALSGLNPLMGLYEICEGHNGVPNRSFYTRVDAVDEDSHGDETQQDVDAQQQDLSKGGASMTPDEIKALQDENKALKEKIAGMKASHAEMKTELAKMQDDGKSACSKADMDAVISETVAKAVTDVESKFASQNKIATEQIAALEKENEAMRAAEDESFLAKHAKRLSPVLLQHYAKIFSAARQTPDSYSVKIGDAEFKGVEAVRQEIASLPESPQFTEYGIAGKKSTAGGDDHDAQVAKFAKENSIDTSTAAGTREVYKRMESAGLLKREVS